MQTAGSAAAQQEAGPTLTGKAQSSSTSKTRKVADPLETGHSSEPPSRDDPKGGAGSVGGAAGSEAKGGGSSIAGGKTESREDDQAPVRPPTSVREAMIYRDGTTDSERHHHPVCVGGSHATPPI